MKLVVGNQQFEEEYIYDSGLPELQSDILPGVETEGVVIFPEIDMSTESITVYSEGYSDNYDLTIEPFVFDLTKQ